MSEAEAAAYLGDLMVHRGRTDAAEKELARAIALDPALPGSYVSMGMSRLRENKREEALTFLTKAIDNDSRNYMAHYAYAQLWRPLRRMLTTGAALDSRRCGCT